MLRSALFAVVSLMALGLAPASAQSPPKSPVFRINPAATGTAAPVEMQDGTGQWVPIGALNPTTHAFVPNGVAANAAAAATAQATANAAVPQSSVGQAGGVAAYGDPRIVGALQQSSLGLSGGPTINAPSSGNPTINAALAVRNILGSDGTVQYRFGQAVGAAEMWTSAGGLAGAGPTQRADSDTSTDVNGTFVAKGRGQINFGNDFGRGFSVANPSATSVCNAQATGGPGAGTAGFSIVTSALATACNMMLVPLGTGALMAHTGDSTATGGNAPGLYAISLMLGRNAAPQVAAANYSVQIGGQLNVIAASAAGNTQTGGYGNNNFGSYGGEVGSVNGADAGRYAYNYLSGGTLGAGPAQSGLENLYGRSTGGAAVRLTATGGAASVTAPGGNCFTISPGQVMALDIMIAGRDVTTIGHRSGYFNKAVIGQDAGPSSTALSLGTATTLGTDTPTVSITADTTLGCVNLTVTPSNSDTWDFNARIVSAEVK